MRLVVFSHLAVTLLAFSQLAGAADSVVADAAKKDDRAAVERLIAAHKDVNAPQIDGTTALHWAAHADDLELAAKLLAAGAKPGAVNRYGMTVMAHGGFMAVLGIPPAEVPVDFGTLVFRQITVKGIYGREMFETWYKMAALLQSGLDLRPIITHHYGVKDFEQGFQTMGSGHSGKVILDWASL